MERSIYQSKEIATPLLTNKNLQLKLSFSDFTVGCCTVIIHTVLAKSVPHPPLSCQISQKELGTALLENKSVNLSY